MNVTEHISSIANRYGIYKYDIERLRSVYKIRSKDKTLIVKRFNSEKKLLNTKLIVEHLKCNNFKYVQSIAYDMNNEFFFKIDNKFYMCFDWIDGREINVRKFDEIKKCIKLVYLYHECVKNIDYHSMGIKDTSDWYGKIKIDVSNLHKIKEHISQKSFFDPLDRFYYDNISKAMVILNNIISIVDCKECTSFLNNHKTLCHNSLYYQNFILNNNRVYLIDFGGVSINCRIYDIARFARRIFYKNNFNPKILKEIYKIYSRYYRFNEIEKLLFHSYIEYPYKFIKFAYKIYFRGKYENINRLVKKLKKYSDYELDVLKNNLFLV